MLGPTCGPDESMGPQFFLTGGDVTILGGMAGILGILRDLGVSMTLCILAPLQWTILGINEAPGTNLRSQVVTFYLSNL